MMIRRPFSTLHEICLFVAMLLTFTVAHGAQIAPTRAETLDWRYFEKNQGQVGDTSIRFLSKGQHYTVGFRDTDVIYALKSPTRGENRAQTTLRYRFPGANGQPVIRPGAVLPATARYLYASGQKTKLDKVSRFADLTYESLFANVDLRYRFHESDLEYDFIVAPHGDYSRIRFAIDGARRVSLGARGELVIRTDNGLLTQKRPYTYQVINGEKREIESRYRIVADNTVAFELGDYDKSREVVIDPEIDFSSYWGGIGNEFIKVIRMVPDGSGDFFVAGNTSSLSAVSLQLDSRVTGFLPGGASTSDSTPGILDCTSQGINIDLADVNDPDIENFKDDLASTREDFDAFVARVSAAGTVQFVTYFGGCGNDGVRDMEVYQDGTGNTFLYVGGYTLSPNFPLQNAAQNTLSPDGNPFKPDSDGFLMKLSMNGDANDGTPVYSTYYGGEGSDGIRDIDVDSAGNVYVAGYTYSQKWRSGLSCQLVGGTGLSSFQCEHAARDENREETDDPYNRLTADAFVARFSSAGSIAYMSFLGGKSDDFAAAINVYTNSSGSDEIVIVGNTSSADFLNTFEPTTFTPVFRQYRAGNGQCSDVFPPVAGDKTELCEDVFILRFDRDMQTLLAGTFFGGDLHDRASELNVDASGNIFIAGVTQGPGLPLENGSAVFIVGTETPEQLETKNNILSRFPMLNDHSYAYGDVVYNTRTLEAYVTKMNNDLTQVLFSTFVHGTDTDTLDVMRIVNDKIYIAGQTWSSDFPVGFNTNAATMPSRRHPVEGDGYVAVLEQGTDSRMSILRYTLFGGEDIDFINAIDVDAAENIILGGSTLSARFPIFGNALPSYINGSFTDTLSNVFTDVSKNSYVQNVFLTNRFDAFLTRWANNATTVDLVADVATSASQILKNSSVRIDITVTNEGVTNARDVALVIEFPLREDEFTNPDAASCQASNNRLYCSMGTISPGTNAQIQLSVKPPRTGRFEVQAFAGSQVADANIADNHAASSVTVVDTAKRASLTLAMLFAFSLVLLGSRGAYRSFTRS